MCNQPCLVTFHSTIFTNFRLKTHLLPTVFRPGGSSTSSQTSLSLRISSQFSLHSSISLGQDLRLLPGMRWVPWPVSGWCFIFHSNWAVSFLLLTFWLVQVPEEIEVLHQFLPGLLALSVQYRLKLHQLDVVTAFLNGNLKEEVYITWLNQKVLCLKDKNTLCVSSKRV